MYFYIEIMLYVSIYSESLNVEGNVFRLDLFSYITVVYFNKCLLEFLASVRKLHRKFWMLVK